MALSRHTGPALIPLLWGLALPKGESMKVGKIEKDVPVPIQRSYTNYNFNKLDVGDSVYITLEENDLDGVTRSRINSVRVCAFKSGQKHGMKFVTKKDANGIRVWRVE